MTDVVTRPAYNRQSYITQQFYGCCGASTSYFAEGKVNAQRLKDTEDTARDNGYGMVLCVVKASQYSVKTLKEQGWEHYATSSGRSGAKLLTFGKVLKEYKPKSRKKVTEQPRVFS